ncbi:MAG TPA: discoidin domain-containing protein [Chloroflexota bacterium]|jgi:hypothetical protein|nr:discoidin domain-containing protein [Chloroflexota bacterium]
MLKAYANARDRCYIHPHRPAEVKCERCKIGLCDECAREYQGQKLCERCVGEILLIEAGKLTFADRVRLFFRSLRNTVIAVAVLAIICGGIFYAFHNLLNQPITPEELARFRYAAAGSFQTPEGINVNSTVLGAQIVSFTSQRTGYEATHLINEYAGPDFPGWRSSNATFPQDIVVAQQNLSTIQKVILTQQPGEPPSTMVKDFEVDASTTGPDSGFVKIGEWQLQQTDGPQRFTFPPTQEKWLRLRILSNYGSQDYTSLAEFDAYVVPQNPGAPSPGGGANPGFGP